MVMMVMQMMVMLLIRTIIGFRLNAVVACAQRIVVAQLIVFASVTATITRQVAAQSRVIVTDEASMGLELLQTALGRLYHLLVFFGRAMLAIG